jgi:hypothetical protein
MLNNARWISRVDIKDLSNADLKRFASDLLQEKDSEMIFRYLRSFTRVPFPFGYDPLVNFATSKNSKIRWQGIQALALFKNKTIRKFALDKIKAGKDVDQYLELLVQNFKQTDNSLILNSLRQMKTEDTFHSAGQTIIHIYEQNKAKGFLDVMLELYGRGTCSLCRHRVVEIMLKNKVLPKILNEEIKYDCYRYLG